MTKLVPVLQQNSLIADRWQFVRRPQPLFLIYLRVDHTFSAVTGTIVLPKSQKRPAGRTGSGSGDLVHSWLAANVAIRQSVSTSEVVL